MYFWKIEGFDGLTRIYEKHVKAGCYNEDSIKQLLRTLAATSGLTFDEIVGAYASKSCKSKNALLEVRKDGLHPIFSCGENPFFTARVVREHS